MMDTIKGAMKNIFGGKDENPIYDDDLVGFVDAEFKRRQQERRPFELQMRLNLCFYDGNQYVDINTAAMSLEEQPVLYDWQEREVFNHIAPNVEVRIANLKRFRSIPRAQPGTSEIEDIRISKVSTQCLKNFHNDLNMSDIQAEEYAWLETCGTVFRKHVWNPQAGKVIGVQITQDEQTGEEKQVEVREGKMDIIVVPALEIFPDSCYRSDLDACRSIIHAKAYHVDDIFDTWGVQVGEEKAEAEKLVSTMNGLSGLGYGQGGFIHHTVKLEKHAIVKEYLERPSSKYPEGRLIIVAGGKKLYAGKLPYLVGDDETPGISLSMLKCLDRPGVFFGKAVMERAIPIQRRYNALRNRKAEYLNRCAIGQWVREEDSMEDPDQLEQNGGFPGQVFDVRKGSVFPAMVQNPSLPSSFESEQQTLLAEFSILFGVSEISRDSGVPAGVKSGVAIDLLKEADSTRISNTVENIERHNIHSAKIQLRLAKQFIKAPQTLQIVGRNNVVEVMDWTGSDLSANDIVIENMSASADSPAQKRQMVFDLLQSGLLQDPDTGRLNKEMRSKVLEMIEIGEWESADDVEQLQIGRAERENKALEQGQLSQAANYDDHIIHISRHNAFRLTTDYEQLLAQNPQIDQVFEMHINMHLMYLQQAAMAQMQAALQQQGGMPQEEAPPEEGPPVH